MSPLFFQHFWSKVREEVTRIVLDSLNSGIVAPNFNETHVVLIPKCKKPMKLLILGKLVYVMWCIKLLPKLLLTV